ncbi:MAG: glycosyltransferase [Burkholderiales bacterium]
MSTFVSVGNATQPFRRLLDGVAAIASELPQPVYVQSGSTPFQADNCEGAPFLGMKEFEDRVRHSTLLIMHAGAGTLITALQERKVPVVMPRRVADGEIIDDHQLEFARELAAAGRIVIAHEAVGLLSAARDALARQSNVPLAGTTPAMVALIGDVLGRYASR